ncbi:hypothetical protein ACQCX2_13990 [Propionibacteriaceae bacterium Y1700]|uniref:hypothetical protein n=1 Tax=Microlunatus sp. Y1700 TaxID=3418487 RepID=UPI003DA6E143
MADSYMGFVGVTTGSSSIMKIFPTWADILGLPTRQLVGHDLPLTASKQDYRDLVTQIADDPHHLGALVTTHKINLFRAAGDLFDHIDEFGTTAGEISSISKRQGQLVGHAKDGITAGLALEEFLPSRQFASTGDTAPQVLCLGAGGAGLALCWYLAQRAERPALITVTDTDPERLDHLVEVLTAAGGADLIRPMVVRGLDDSARVLSEQPAGSLVVNATGLGKDRPGSPLPDNATWPEGGLVWEFNYRGTLEFWHQARLAAPSYDLTVVDGWRYFIHGWTQVIAEVFDLDLTPELVDRLAEAARSSR